MRDRTSEANSISLVGRHFGRLVATRRVRDHITKGGNVLTAYECLCECGNKIEVLAMNLVSGNTLSCGCIGSSTGEAIINDILVNSGIAYIRQYTIRDLVSPLGYPLKFDFAVVNDDKTVKFLLEYNGEQHYYPITANKEFGKLQREVTDKMKKDYCEKNNIPFYVILFDENIGERVRDILRQYE